MKIEKILENVESEITRLEELKKLKDWYRQEMKDAKHNTDWNYVCVTQNLTATYEGKKREIKKNYS